MPRKSAAALATVTPLRPRPHLAPSSDAPAEVRKLFGEIVTSAPEGHFQPSDGPLLQEYATAIYWARQATAVLGRDGPLDGKGRPTGWIVIQEKNVRAITSLSARLRLSPQHRDTSRSTGRALGKLPPSPYEGLDG